MIFLFNENKKKKFSGKKKRKLLRTRPNTDQPNYSASLEINVNELG